MSRSQINPHTIDGNSTMQNKNGMGFRNKTYSQLPNPMDVQHVINRRQMPFYNQGGEEIEEIYNRNPYNHKIGNSTMFPNENSNMLKRVMNKNASVSLHNLNNFGYLKERNSIKKPKKRKSIFR